VYAFDIEKNTLAPYLASSSVSYLTSSFSSDGINLAFSRIDDAMNIFVKSQTGEEKKMTGNTEVLIRRNPVWSPSGETIAYLGRRDANGNGLNPEEWQIYILNTKNGNERFITNGSNPLFTPGGDILVLKGDGLYLIDLFTNIGERVWDVSGGKAFAHMKLNISRDGKYIAWAVPHQSRVIILEVTSWRPFSASIIKEFPSTAFWPVFSPDARWLALQEVDGANTTTPNPRLIIFNLETGDKQTLLDLKSYDNQAMFVTDWI